MPPLFFCVDGDVKMADLAQIKSGDREIEIVNPGTTDKIGVRVKLMSIDDERMQKIKRRITDERLRLEQRGKVFKAEEIEENRNNILFNAMIDWEWYNPTGKAGDKGFDPDAAPEFEGGVPQFDRRSVINVLTKLPWFADQVNEAVGDTKAFFTTSKPI
jgi:hypothetical protein